MERVKAIEKLSSLVGSDLHQLGKNHLDVTIVNSKTGKANKGWAGHILERELGLPLNSSREPNLGSWELKLIPLKWRKDGSLTYKETMAVTMIDPVNVLKTPFEDSHLLVKLKRIIIVTRTVGATFLDPTYIHSINEVKLEGEAYNIVKEDYELVRVKIEKEGFDSLTGKMGRYIQPRTKGTGHGSTSRAFYARTKFLETVLPPLN